MDGRYREGKAQLPLADERLQVLIPQSVRLPFHQLRLATQRGELTLAKLQHSIDQHLAIHLSHGSGLRGDRLQTRPQRLRERLQIVDHRQSQLSRDQPAMRVALVGQIW